MQEIAFGNVVEVVRRLQPDTQQRHRTIAERALVDVRDIHNQLEQRFATQSFRHPFFEQGREALLDARLGRLPNRHRE